MSVQSTQSSIERIQREIQSLQRQLTDETSKEASKTGRILQIRKSITSSTSLSSVQTKQREIERIEGEIVNVQKKKADLNKRISDKTSDLHKLQQTLFREQDREQKKFMESIQKREEATRRAQERRFYELAASHNPSPGGVPLGSPPDVMYDAFISHASEDKDDLVRPLAEKLKEAGLSIWYDEFNLTVGDSLRRSIDRGLANSRFGIVVLSPAFFAKNWPQYELDGLVAKEQVGGKVVLPLWHKVSKDEVMARSPTLADRVALNTAMYTIEELAQKLSSVLKEGT